MNEYCQELQAQVREPVTLCELILFLWYKVSIEPICGTIDLLCSVSKLTVRNNTIV